MRFLLMASAVLLGASGAMAQPADLARLEEAMAMYVGSAAQHPAVADAAQCFADDQRRWLEETTATCSDDACRADAYLKRLAELSWLQPGMNKLADVALPEDVPRLVAVVAPEDDEMGTPKDFETPPDFTVEGSILLEVDDPMHSGLALRDAGGGTHVIVSLMEFGNQASHEALHMSATADPDSRYRVRGVGVDAAGDGVLDFGISQCRFVYSLP